MNLYGILIGIGVVIAIELIKRKNSQISYVDILIILLFTLLGARILFLLNNISEIRQGEVNPIAIWDGGLAFYGGLIGLLISILLISKQKKVSLFTLSDSILLFLPLAHAIGRIGNFFNYELYGKATTLPWAIYIPTQYRVVGYEQFEYFHPLFLYESILNIVNFISLLLINKKMKTKGLTTGIYLINYSLIRLFLNTLRIDKEYFLNMETSNIFSFVFLVTGIIIIFSIMKNKTKQL